MIDLYALTSPNVQKIYVMLEECGLLYKEHFVDVWKGEQYKPEFSKINPNNKIPAIVDHEGPGGKPFTVIESGAILMYLAEKTGKFLPKEMAKKYEVLQWLLIQLTGVGPMFGQWTHFKLFAPKGNDYANHDAQGVKWEDNPNLARWFNAISERPAVKAALGKVSVIKSNRETASEEDKDRFFNRGRYARA